MTRDKKRLAIVIIQEKDNGGTTTTYEYIGDKELLVNLEVNLLEKILAEKRQ